MSRHEWVFGNATRGDGNVVTIATCSKCGLARIATVRETEDSFVDLRGECPGEPYEPADTTPSIR